MANRVNQRKGLAAWPEIPSCQIYPLVAVMFNHRKVCKCECWSPLAKLQLLVGSGNLKSLEPTVWIPYGVRLLNRYCIYCILRYSLFAILHRVYCHNCMQVSPFGQVIPSVWFFSNCQAPAPAARYHGSNFCTPFDRVTCSRGGNSRPWSTGDWNGN